MKTAEEKRQIEFNSDMSVNRKFTEQWRKSGLINTDEIPRLIESLVEKEKSMVAYIEALHDKLDFIIKKNHICHIPSCHTANCDSDHK